MVFVLRRLEKKGGGGSNVMRKVEEVVYYGQYMNVFLGDMARVKLAGGDRSSLILTRALS